MAATASEEFLSGADEPDYSHIEYGGVWRQLVKVSKEPTEVIEFAMDFLQERQTQMAKDVKRVLKEKSFKVLSMRKVALQLTLNDREPAVEEKLKVTSDPNDPVPLSYPILLGHTYTFRLEWMSKKWGLQTHQFTVTESPKSRFHIFSHSSPTTPNSGGLSGNASKEQEGSTGHLERERVHSVYSEEKNLAPVAGADSKSGAAEPRDATSRSFTPNRACPAGRERCEGDQSVDVEKSVQASPTPQPSLSVRVMCYNVWNFNAAQDRAYYDKRIKRLGQVCLQASPDIIGFQEVRFSRSSISKRGPNQVDHLAKLLPNYQFVHQPAQMFPSSLHNGRNEEGIAIFSKFPILSSDYILLFRNRSNSADLHQRVCLHAEILLPRVGVVHVYNAHLSLSHEARERSVAQIWEFIQRKKGPAIFLGDLNAQPEEKAIRYLVEDTQMVDAWDVAAKDSPGYTFSALEEEPWKRIDYIFVRNNSNIKVTNVEILREKEKQKHPASDHYPLVATVAVSAP